MGTSACIAARRGIVFSKPWFLCGLGLLASWFALISPLHGGEAEIWVPASATALREALTDRTVDYSDAWQRFDASGKTLYNAGSDSWGTWDTRGDQYCSRWPPSTDWTCYDVELSDDGSKVRFLGFGDVTIGTFRN